MKEKKYKVDIIVKVPLQEKLKRGSVNIKKGKSESKRKRSWRESTKNYKLKKKKRK